MSCTLFVFDLVSLFIYKLWYTFFQRCRYGSCIFSFQSVQDINYNIINNFSAGSTFASNLFLYCYFGERTTQNYLSFGHLLYESKWSRFPLQIQKSMVKMIAVGQRPLYYHGLGLAYLNLYTFGRVNIPQFINLQILLWYNVFFYFRLVNWSVQMLRTVITKLLHGHQNPRC